MKSQILPLLTNLPPVGHRLVQRVESLFGPPNGVLRSLPSLVVVKMNSRVQIRPRAVCDSSCKLDAVDNGMIAPFPTEDGHRMP